MNRLDPGGRYFIPQPDWIFCLERDHQLAGGCSGRQVGTLFSIAGFRRWCYGGQLGWAGCIYKAEVTFDKLVQALGLAYAWQLIGVLGVLPAFSTALAYLLAPVMVIAASSSRAKKAET